MICNLCLSVTARKLVRADPSLRYTTCCWDVKKPTNQQTNLSLNIFWNKYIACLLFYYLLCKNYIVASFLVYCEYNACLSLFLFCHDCVTCFCCLLSMLFCIPYLCFSSAVFIGCASYFFCYDYNYCVLSLCLN